MIFIPVIPVIPVYFLPTREQYKADCARRNRAIRKKKIEIKYKQKLHIIAREYIHAAACLIGMKSGTFIDSETFMDEVQRCCENDY